MDHFAPPGLPEHDSFEAWTVATALAMQTERIRVGHMVLCDAFRHPALLAKMAATLDVLSGGRLDLGIGWGSAPAELHTYGVGRPPAAELSARLGETLPILRAMFSGERFDYDGRFFQLEGAIGRPRPVQDPLPVHIGGGGPKLTMPLVRDHANWWNCPSYAVDRLPELRALAGDARISVQHPIGLAVDAASHDTTVAEAEKRFGWWGGLITGTPAEVADALAAEVASGVEGFLFQFSDFGAPDTLACFMEEVAPVVTAA
jgi:alkanesulfonate monooxygenase SsuD/methylene tetrahydromethanopterin reductase-like flavin-dependent oxidoreductase (luciferase family)